MNDLMHADIEYKQWIADICCRFRRSQIKAASKVCTEMLRFYWSIGKDIEERYASGKWGDKIIAYMSKDLQREIPDAHCFSRTNLYYIKKFYTLYSQVDTIIPQLGGQLEEIDSLIFSIPWGHHIEIVA